MSVTVYERRTSYGNLLYEGVSYDYLYKGTLRKSVSGTSLCASSTAGDRPINGKVEYMIGTPRAPLSSKSSIVDRYKFKPVTHRKISHKIYAKGPDEVWFNCPLNWRYKNMHYYTLRNSVHSLGPSLIPHEYLASKALVKPVGFRPTDAQIDYAFRKALSETALLNLEDMNLAAFLGELRQIRDLIDVFNFKWLKQRDISGKYLGVQFGVLPFASDITKILNNISKLPDSINRWNKLAAGGKVLNQHFSIIGRKDDVSSVAYEYWDGTLTCETLQTHTSMNGSETYHAKGSIYYKPEPFNLEFFAELKSKILGFDQLFDATWQLMPWSWMVDWFINLGDYISQFDKVNPMLNVTIVDMGWSIKHQIKLGTYTRCEFNASGVWLPRHTVDYNYDSYERFTYDKTRLNNEVFGILEYKFTADLFKASIGTALLHQRFSK